MLLINIRIQLQLRFPQRERETQRIERGFPDHVRGGAGHESFPYVASTDSAPPYHCGYHAHSFLSHEFVLIFYVTAE